MKKIIEEFELSVKVKAAEHEKVKYVWPLELLRVEWESHKQSLSEKFNIDITSGMAYNLEVSNGRMNQIIKFKR